MNWRELWKSTVTNLRVLLGFSPPPSSTSSGRSSSAANSLHSKRKPMPPVSFGDHADPANQTSHSRDLTSTRSLPHAPSSHAPSLPRTRPTSTETVDVALDAAAFAAAKSMRTEQPTPAPEMTWNRQGVVQVELPSVDAPGNMEPFEADDPVDNGPFDSGALIDGPVNNGPVVNGQNHEYHNQHRGNGYGDDGRDDASNNGGNNGDEYGDDEGVALTTLLESLLFVASEPVDPRQLAQTLAQPLEIIELGLAELGDYYQRSLRGLRLQRFNNKVQLVTASASAPFIEAFLNLDNSTRLSSPALETLAVIAYRQPVTRAQIEAVRGVDCSGVLRSLMQRGLVAEVGRLEGIGRPILYGVTELFMQHFGLMEMGELPPLEETDADRLWAATVLDEQELDGPQNAAG